MLGALNAYVYCIYSALCRQPPASVEPTPQTTPAASQSLLKRVISQNLRQRVWHTLYYDLFIILILTMQKGTWNGYPLF